MNRKFTTLVLLLLGMCINLRAEPGLLRFVPNFIDHSFTLEEETTDIENQTELGPFPSDILLEAGLESFSRWKLTTKEGMILSAEVYQTSDTSGAYQLYLAWPALSGYESTTIAVSEPISHRFGPEASSLWRGNFFVQLTPTGQKELGLPLVSELVNQFVQSVSTENLLPVSVTHMPIEERVTDSLRFYLGSETLSSNPQFPAPLLKEIGFADRIEIAFAQYEPGGEALFLIGYPTPALADQYFIKLQNRLQGFFSEVGVYMKRAGVLICLFIGPEERAQAILPRVKYAPSIQWLYEKDSEPDFAETITFLGLITSAILGTGTFLLMILGSGLTVGLIRYGFIQRFPSLTRKKRMVRLDLDGH